ncbi:MspA family porin [Nocardia sp. NPDC051900]|uniref:MspA family porin n=2 Tax=unclassified Nocardia TaxID=2637762 RepID=UPI0037BBAC64
MMNRRHSRTLAAIIAVVVTATGAFAVSDSAAGAAPGEINAGGLHLIASANANNFAAAGDIAPGIPFVHSVRVSGDFSVSLDGPTALRGGEIAVGYLVGCAVDISNGISIGISPSVGINAGIAPSFGLEGSLTFEAPSLQMNMPDQHMMMPSLQLMAPPSVSVGAAVAIQPSIGVEAGVAGELAVNLAPGSVTAAVVGAAEIDGESEFPYTFAHTNTPLNVSGCLSPASAMPFVTVRADSKRATAQTTGYGAAFWF